jgi:hypothetical protein
MNTCKADDMVIEPCIRDMYWIRRLLLSLIICYEIPQNILWGDPDGTANMATWPTIVLYISTVRSLQSLIILKPIENVQVIKRSRASKCLVSDTAMELLIH